MSKIRQLYSELFNDGDFYRQMLKLSLPVVLQNFISSFLNMIDTVMVGKLGETEIAAVGIANQYFFFFYDVHDRNFRGMRRVHRSILGQTGFPEYQTDLGYRFGNIGNGVFIIYGRGLADPGWDYGAV